MQTKKTIIGENAQFYIFLYPNSVYYRNLPFYMSEVENEVKGGSFDN